MQINSCIYVCTVYLLDCVAFSSFILYRPGTFLNEQDERNSRRLEWDPQGSRKPWFYYDQDFQIFSNSKKNIAKIENLIITQCWLQNGRKEQFEIQLLFLNAIVFFELHSFDHGHRNMVTLMDPIPTSVNSFRLDLPEKFSARTI